MTLTKFNNRNNLSGYLIVISPPKEITDYMNGIKKEFYEAYGNYKARFSKPHITICNFPLLEERQDKVFSTLQKGLLDAESFELKLDGFGSFVNSNVIYFNVEESKELQSLRKFFIYKNVELRLGKKFFLFSKPHLTIAKELKGDVFESAKSSYLSRSYHNSFPVDTLKVLRYDINAARYFEFMDLKLGASINAKQQKI